MLDKRLFSLSNVEIRADDGYLLVLQEYEELVKQPCITLLFLLLSKSKLH